MKTHAMCTEAIEALNGWEDGLGAKIYVSKYEKPQINKQHHSAPDRTVRYVLQVFLPLVLFSPYSQILLLTPALLSL